ncbi:hypothetical protein ROZALSC1DRAFT_26474 [Rozella allomycis CSF55]|uniref:LMBR1-like membrane protein domain-containing protein n=1 Tax=Rozella allomycis (strain CSF55) TaxID=988480 RepID=A0A075AVI8_ROZAC|nr:LMBR1-like membrane protein domain-containing protein [Rozella allomycis CSF55]RKP22137.1 hypothetical protein ROZALSC1DRAFT_26474 [Rozella allomycis CSF55]|eukprot:EPZ34343.1 LMBR1-like membrane protein domain-containing protein [Rozella allomycis CSF55]
MNIGLIVTTAIFAVLVLVGAIYFLVYFQHPEDKWVAWLPKLVVVYGVFVACCNVLLLPLDVANQNLGYLSSGGLPMETLNYIFFMSTVVLCICVIPFTVFYYEGADNPDGEPNIFSQAFNGFKYLLFSLGLFILVVAPAYWFLGYAEVSTVIITGNFINGTSSITGNYCDATLGLKCAMTTTVEKVTVSLIIYVIAMTTLMGWILFSVFGGIGLFSLPVDLLLSFKNRPKPLKKSEYIEKKKIIGEVATALMKNAEALKLEEKALGSNKNSRVNKRARVFRAKEAEFKRDVYLLEESYKKLEAAYKIGTENPVVTVFKGITGIIGFLISFLWFIHLLIYVLPVSLNYNSLSTFLNDIFVGLESSVPFIGTFLYGLFSFWLLVCTIKGAISVGIRVLFVQIHPMKIGETFMSSLLFNVGLINYASLSVVQFCSIAFAEYARYTSIMSLFSTQVQNLAYLKYGYIIFIWIFMSFAAFSTLYLKLRPVKKIKKVEI